MSQTSKKHPRPYQIDLYQQALERNSIAFLDTGAGKTLVAILMMQHFQPVLNPLTKITLDRALDLQREIAELMAQKFYAEQQQLPAEADNLLSAILAKEKAARLLLEGRSKRIVFLVPTIPLVRQQAEAIRDILDLEVGEISSEIRNKVQWDFVQWQVEIARYHVIVMTPQTLVNSLRHGYLNMSLDISLMIIDECHHTTKNHPYNILMSEFYHPLKKTNSVVPRIFGMTASPVMAQVLTHTLSMEKLVELQTNLDSVIITVKDKASLHRHLAKARESIVEFGLNYSMIAEDGLNISDSHPTTHAAMVYRHHMTRLVKMHNKAQNRFTASRIRNLINFVIDMLREMGVWCSALLAREYANTAYAGIRSHASKVEGSLNQFESVSSPSSRHLLFTHDSSTIPAIVEYEGVDDEKSKKSDGLHSLFEESSDASNPGLDDESLETVDVSGKLRRLCLILKRAMLRSVSPPSTIIFVERRSTAKILADFIAKFEGRLFPGIKCGHVVGASLSSSARVTKIDQPLSKQLDVFEQFRNREINTLIVTSVAEEGIDIHACNLVIIFDLFRSATSYIQTRGRARNANSDFIILVEQGNKDKLNQIAQARVSEMVVKHTIHAAVSKKELLISEIDRSVAFDDDAEVDNLLGTNVDDGIFKIESTGASFSRRSALDILKSYCSSIPCDKYTSKRELELNVTQDEQWSYQCTIKFPQGCPLCGLVFSSPYLISRKMAIRYASFTACKYLYLSGALNDNLDPRDVSKNPSRNSRKRPRSSGQLPNPSISASDNPVKDGLLHYKTYVPKSLQFNEKWRTIEPGFQKAVEMSKLFNLISGIDRCTELFPHDKSESTRVAELYATAITFSPDGRGFMLLTADEIPELFSFDVCLNFDRLPVTFHRLGFITFSGKRYDLMRKFLPCLFAMVIREQVNKLADPKSVDCEYLPEDSRFFAMLPSKASDSIQVIDWELTECICNYTASKKQDVFEPGSLVITLHNNLKYIVIGKSAEATTDSLIDGKISYRHYYREKYNIDLSMSDSTVYNVRHIPSLKNHLALKFAKEPAEAPVSSDSMLAIPAELLCRLPIDKAYFELACVVPSIMFRVEAILRSAELKTTIDVFKNVSLSELYAASCSLSAKDIRNYELMETLGDTYLKCASSTYFYCRFTGAGEGALTESRRDVITNNYLYLQADRLQLYNYIITQAFHPRSWAPPGIIAYHPKRYSEIPSTMTTLSVKVLADFVEALLGACVMNGGTELAFEFLVFLQVIPSLSPISNFSSFSMEGVNADAFNLKAVESKVKYCFKNKALLLQAFTHSSCSYASWPSYQRLEFLGDALLDFIIARYLYIKYPNSKPSQLSDMKQNAVNNSSFARISIDFNLVPHIMHSSNVLMKQLSEYMSWYEGGKYENESPLELEREGPKVMGDIVEAVVGAIYEDLKFDVMATWNVVAHMFVPFIEKHCHPDNMGMAPMRLLYDYVVSLGINQDSLMVNLRETSSSQFHCIISLDGQEIASHSSDSKNVAKRLAAVSALQHLKTKRQKT